MTDPVSADLTRVADALERRAERQAHGRVLLTEAAVHARTLAAVLRINRDLVEFLRTLGHEVSAAQAEAVVAAALESGGLAALLGEGTAVSSHGPGNRREA